MQCEIDPYRARTLHFALFSLLCSAYAGRPLQCGQRGPIHYSTMTRAEDIQQLIEAGLPGAQVRVSGDDGQHFEAVIVSADFAGKSLVQQHQLVYRALGQNMRDAVIHALALRTLTPEQYAAEGGH